MFMQINNIKKARIRRKYRVRKRILGTSERPRLSVFRSSRHIYAQIIDDIAGVTLASASTRSKNLRSGLSNDDLQRHYDDILAGIGARTSAPTPLQSGTGQKT